MLIAKLCPPTPGRKNNAFTFWMVLGTSLAVCSVSLPAVETNFTSQIQQLLQDNAAMRAQMQKQQQVIETLTHEVAQIHQSEAQRDRELGHLKNEIKEPEAAPAAATGFSLGKVRISGEGGVGFFNSGSEGTFPNAEFRVDEVKLFVDAPVWGEVYAFAELNLASHEASDLYVNVGELYLDFE